MRAIFISYRREDTEGQAGRLFDDLVKLFGEQSVFMDVAGIEPGRDFRKAIDEHVASCGVLLALIGKNWVDARDEAGRRRIDDPLDFVRLETAAALKRDIPVVPVLVRGASMPRADQLPPDLADLAFRNAIELTHARWTSDLTILGKALSRHLTPSQPDTADRGSTERGTQTVSEPPKSATPRRAVRRAIWLAVIAVVLSTGAVGWGVFTQRAEIARREAVAVETSSKQEEARQAAEKTRLDEEARQVAEKTRLDEVARQAAEKTRRDEEARQAAEKTHLDEVARQAAEKTRLDEVARQAAEKTRLDEVARQAAEKTRLDEEARQVAEKTRLDEVARQAAEKTRRNEEERTLSAAMGNLTALRAYLSTCKACAFETAARAEISRLEPAELKRRASSAMLCGRSINYVVDGIGAPEPHRSFLGVWPDASWNAGMCGSLVVERVQSDGAAQIKYVYGPNGPTSKVSWVIQNQRAVIKNGQLSFRDNDGNDFVFILTKNDTLHAHFDGGTTLDAVFRRDPSSVP